MTKLLVNDIESYVRHFNERMQAYRNAINSPDYLLADAYVRFAEALDKIENRPTYILDLYSSDFLFVSPKYLNLLGIESQREIDFDLFINAQHPDDISLNLQGPSEYIDLLCNLEAEEKRAVKLVSDFRLLMATGDYVRVTEQITLLETDTEQNPWLVIAICDTAMDQDVERESGAIILNSTTGKVYKSYGRYEQLLPRKVLTPREYEVVEMIARGYSSKQIAEILYISPNTVNNHRRNIIAKTGCSNTFEAIKYLGGIG